MGTNNERIDGGTLDRLRECSTAAIADTNHESVETVAPAIEPVHSDCAFAGVARTVRLDPSALWAPVQTLDTARENEVIVVDANDSIDEAVWGELLSTYAMASGVRGAVTNGAVRDIAGIEEIGFPVFARAVTPRGPSGDEEAERNTPVSVGGVSIAPGDVLVGDESGVVTIERSAVDEVTTAAEGVVRTEHEVDRLLGEAESLERAFEKAGM